jgi:sugar phosphate isomerase/epimerase
VIHDAGNMVFEGFESYRMGLEVLGPYLAHVHLKNARWSPAGSRADGTIRWAAAFAPLGEGSVDVRELLRALRAVGYDGWISFEDFSTDRPLLDRTRANLESARELLAAAS